MKADIQKLHADDMDLLLDIRMEVLDHVFSEEKKTISDEDWQKIREENEKYYRTQLETGGHVACLARVEGEIAGCGGVCLYQEMPSPDNRNGRCAYLMNIYTREAYRNQGIARVVVEYLIGEARKRGVEKIYLETSEEGRPLYESMGFCDMHDYMKLPETIVMEGGKE